MVEFSNNNSLPTYQIFDDLITTINFQHPKILDCIIKKCVKIDKKKILPHQLFSLLQS